MQGAEHGGCNEEIFANLIFVGFVAFLFLRGRSFFEMAAPFVDVEFWF